MASTASWVERFVKLFYMGIPTLTKHLESVVGGKRIRISTIRSHYYT